MNKRRRTSSVASRGTEDDGDDIPPEPTKRRKKLDPSDLCQQLYDVLRNQKKEDGSLLCDAFIRVPKRRQEPGYYEVVSNPIDLLKVQQKLKTDEYRDMDDLAADIQLMVNNAKAFYMRTSPEYKDATELWELCVNTKNRIMEEYEDPEPKGKLILKVGRLARKATRQDDAEDTSESSINLDEETMQLFEDLFAAVMTATDPIDNNRPLHIVFQLKPSKKLYPEYYDVIETPIDLKTIARKIQEGAYSSIGDMEKDLILMCRNACQFNEPGSQIYKDAKLLKKIITAAAKRQDSGLGSNTPKIATTAPRVNTCAVKLQKIMQEKVQELLEFDQDSDSDSESENSSQQPRLIKRASNLLTRGKYKDNIPLKKRLYALVKCVIEYVCEDGRQPMLMFMEKPSKKLYPDYYQVIAEPIDMLAIEANIKVEKYQSENELIQDFKLMFNNCRQYNEEGSLIYEDANTLEKVLMDKVKELGPLPDNPKSKSTASTPTRNVGRPRKVVPLHLQKLRTLYDTIKDYHDAKGRQLSLIFMKLPNKNEYPDYYEVIKQPIHMEKIAATLKNNGYDNLDELVSDFILMFDNACKYNEPDSQIYKDALILQRLVLQSKLQLSEDDESVPDVSAAVQEILATIFTALYNHQDEEGRCYSDSMAELPEHDIVDGKKVRGLSLDLIKRRLDRGVYKRLDRFQEDVFTCLERARRLSRTDSQPFEDSVELQAFFLRTRDEVTRAGDLLHSPALNYTLLDLSAQVAELKRIKQQQELNLPNEDESCDGNETKDPETNTNTDTNNSDNGGSMSFNQEVYRAGDFAYIEPIERGMEYSVVLIERLWTNAESQQMLYGNLFYRPSETYHVASRKFLDKELFKSDAHVAVPLAKVAGRCCVLSVKDYFRMQPEGFLEKDVYVCESRYSTKARAFKKIKVWNFDPDHLKLLPREKPLEPKRVISVYKERLEKHKEEIAELEEGEKLMEKERPNVILYNPEDTENTYYEQYNTCVGSVKTGDFVYVATDGGRQQIAQIDAIWSTKDGKCYFKGPWLLMPTEVPHTPTKLFYKQELFLSTVDGTHPIVAIVGKSAVLDYGEYICSRPTEIPEDDIYICESLYDETKNLMKKLGQEGLKKFNHSSAVTEDEIYFFRRPINPAKVSSDVAQTQNQVKSVTPSSAQFEMWRKLPAGEKQAWEERAIKMNEDGGQLKTTSVNTNSMQDVVYECCWDNCDWQFEDMTDCIDHCIAEQNGHVQSSFVNAPSDVEYQCQWRGCGRTKKSVPPFPSVQRLARHVKEVHILKSHGRIIPPSERSRNYMPSKGPTVLPPMETGN
ncbi:hypothetical protein DMN91_001059 [Ooceraea biroi]|uniref:Protein polybromo-1 n=1 Tax=Ooceraea biroi TaxID=2015173 RepID=A0A3L8E653_OOCBI|nr:hypothetical protein DMN91_001059 [Ooceraea biroi]